MPIHPYLNFGGTCRAAFTRYHEVLGGELEILSMSDIPGGEVPEGVSGDLVAHAALRVGDGLLMGSDVTDGEPGGVRGAYVNYTLADLDEARRVFQGLADGGEVGMPLEATFWSPLFGHCVDRFGVGWMVNVEPGDEG